MTWKPYTDKLADIWVRQVRYRLGHKAAKVARAEYRDNEHGGLDIMLFVGDRTAEIVVEPDDLDRTDKQLEAMANTIMRKVLKFA